MSGGTSRWFSTPRTFPRPGRSSFQERPRPGLANECVSRDTRIEETDKNLRQAGGGGRRSAQYTDRENKKGTSTTTPLTVEGATETDARLWRNQRLGVDAFLRASRSNAKHNPMFSLLRHGAQSTMHHQQFAATSPVQRQMTQGCTNLLRKWTGKMHGWEHVAATVKSVNKK